MNTVLLTGILSKKEFKELSPEKGFFAKIEVEIQPNFGESFKLEMAGFSKWVMEDLHKISEGSMVEIIGELRGQKSKDSGRWFPNLRVEKIKEL